MAIRPDGLVLPCCRYPHLNILKEENLLSDDPRKLDHWYEIRQKMLNGEQVEGCFRCYKQEKNNVRSIRQDSLPRGTYHTSEPADLRFLEIAFSNLCNLACVSCNSEFSSKWKSENLKHGHIENEKAFVSYNFEHLNLDLSKVETLKIIGGEPLLEQEKFIRLMEKLNLENVSLHIHTNGTIIPNDRFKELMQRCRSARVVVSVDGLGKVNDWYRWPSKWEEIEGNLNQYNSWWKNNPRFSLAVHRVTNVYNIWTIKEYNDYFKINFPNWDIEWAFIEYPKWQTLSVIPEPIKKELIDKFSQLIDRDMKNKPFSSSIKYLLEPPKTSWKIFKAMTNQYEKERNLKVLEMVPDLKDAWERY